MKNINKAIAFAKKETVLITSSGAEITALNKASIVTTQTEVLE